MSINLDCVWKFLDSFNGTSFGKKNFRFSPGCSENPFCGACEAKRLQRKTGQLLPPDEKFVLLKNLIEFYDYFVFVLPMFVFLNFDKRQSLMK